MHALSTKPAVWCPLRDRLVEPTTCTGGCLYLDDYTEYYLPREGGVVYCKFSFSDAEHFKAYQEMRKGVQDEAMKQMHRDEAARLRKAAGL